MKVLVAYHGNCTDGFAAAWAVHSYYRYELEMDSENIIPIPVSYGPNSLLPIIDALEATHCEPVRLYIVDFSYSLEDLERLWADYPAIQYIKMYDHHRTAMERFGDPDREVYKGHYNGIAITIDQRESGASLTWKLLFGTPDTDDELPNLIKYVKDYDLWQFKYPQTKAINKYLRMQSQDFATWEDICTDLDVHVNHNRIVERGNAMLQYHESIVEELVTKAEPIELAGEQGLVVNCTPTFASDVGNVLATKCDFGATWHQEKGQVKFSLRSKGDYDVSALAKKFGGGGHKNAAGFLLSAPAEGEIFPDADTKIGVSLWRV